MSQTKGRTKRNQTHSKLNILLAQYFASIDTRHTHSHTHTHLGWIEDSSTKWYNNKKPSTHKYRYWKHTHTQGSNKHTEKYLRHMGINITYHFP